ncbi:MFS transporter [Actinoalloteichus caeruleus]|uniref:Arabinose efflux permease, MFS family n=1 Tax=Actinoalloteichus caeruleus DSM 43889 TaxID=1120930 RepID=A0ABT1JH14_ACTCY|nr:MFS transporter [Actinoalloteichus caeruleus]MCP2331791.1 putative arabinose efflux permease, MFS family [Actinoalloteichus caeruleus DSM 43889]
MKGSSLRHHHDFRLLWAGETTAHFGKVIGTVLIPLVAATALGASPFEMGLLTAASTSAFLVLGLPAGAIVDRVRRRPLMIRCDLARAALLATVPLAWWWDALTFGHLLVVALLVGVCTVFFDVSYQSILPSLVGRSRLVEGNTKLQASESVAQVSGRPAAGGLAHLVGAGGGVVVTAACYLVSAVSLSRMRVVEEPRPRPQGQRLRTEVMEGVRFVFAHPVLRALALCTGTANLFGGVFQAVVMLFLVREVGLAPGPLGLLMAAGSLGGVLGALSAGWWVARVGQIRTCWLSLLLTTPFGLLCAFAEKDWRLGLFALGEFVFSFGVIVYNVAQVSLRQSITPDHLLGRMNASLRFLAWGLIPLGGLLGGVLGEWLGVREALVVAAVGQCLAIAWVVLSPLYRDPASVRAMVELTATEPPDGDPGVPSRT